jgi:hypothetical protein
MLHITKDVNGGFEIKVSKECFEYIKSAIAGTLLTEVITDLSGEPGKGFSFGQGLADFLTTRPNKVFDDGPGKYHKDFVKK